MKFSAQQLTNIGIGTTDTWHVYIDGIDSNVEGYFPAISVDETFGGIESKTIDLGITSIQVPERETPYALSVTFVDDKTLSLYRQLYEWSKECFSNGLFDISAARNVIVTRFDKSTNVTVFRTVYKCVPKIEFKYLGTDDVQPITNTCEFMILDVNNNSPIDLWTEDLFA